MQWFMRLLGVAVYIHYKKTRSNETGHIFACKSNWNSLANLIISFVDSKLQLIKHFKHTFSITLSRANLGRKMCLIATAPLAWAVHVSNYELYKLYLNSIIIL